MRGGINDIEAPVQPAALKYARETSGLSVEDVEEHFGDIRKWESGVGGKPTVREAKHLAELYRRPRTFFYLRKIPDDMKDPEPPDFRREDRNKPLSANLRYLLRQAHSRQKWAREFLEESPESGRFNPPPGFGKHSRADAEELGARIREWLGVDDGKLAKIGKRAEALEYWRQLAEDRGVIVLQSNTHPAYQVTRREFSGCAMADKAAPVVVLNSADTDAKRIFTLAHELAHLWTGKPGMSRISFREHIFAGDDDEAYCDRAAAAALLPRDDFAAKWKNSKGSAGEKIAAITRAYKVSNSAAAVRAKNLGFIGNKECKELLGKYYGIAAKKTQDQKLRKDALKLKRAAAPPEKTANVKKKENAERRAQDGKALRRFGGYFAALALNAYEQGEITARDAGALVDIKLDDLSGLAKKLDISLHRWGG